MKEFFKRHLILLMTMMILLLPVMSFAATTNPSSASSGYVVIPIQISGQYTATTAAVAKFKSPFPFQVVHISATARAAGGTSPTLTVDVKQGSTSLLTAPISVTAGTVSDGTLATSPSIPDEANVSVDLTIGGTTPTWNDITVLIALKRL